MKTYLLYILLTSVAVCSLSAVRAQQVDQTVARKEIAHAAARMQTMQCDFVQTKHLQMLADQMVSQGRLYYQQSDKLRWQYTKPYDYTFVINGSQVIIRNGGRTDRIDASQSKVFREIARIMMNSVLGRNLADNRDFKTSIAASAEGWTATLVPLRKDMRRMFQTIRLSFDRRQAAVTRVEMTEQNGDRTVIELKNIKINETLPKNAFAVD